MKDAMDSTAARRAPDPATTSSGDDFSNRKLIRPALPREETNHRAEPIYERRERPAGAPRKNSVPSEQTHAENFYYQKQIQSRTMMVIVLKDGEPVHGTLEWYDRNCIKVNRSGGQGNLLIYKPSIKYIYKEGENNNQK